MMDDEVTTGAKHGLDSWRVHPNDCQSTLYICRCGYETGYRYGLDAHVRYGNADLL